MRRLQAPIEISLYTYDLSTNKFSVRDQRGGRNARCSGEEIQCPFHCIPAKKTGFLAGKLMKNDNFNPENVIFQNFSTEKVDF